MTKNLDVSDKRTLSDAMQSKQFPSGECIIKYGDIGDFYFVLAQGKVNIKVYEPGTSPTDPDLD